MVGDLLMLNLDTSTKAGSNFEMQAVSVFWNDTSFMQNGLPSGSKRHEPVTIYFEILLRKQSNIK